MEILQVIEEIIAVRHSYKGIGRRSYEYQAFFRTFLAQNYYKIASMTELIKRLHPDPNLRQLCGFKTVPSNATFSRRLNDLSQAHLMDWILEKLLKKSYGNLLVIHLCRDSSIIEAREKALLNEGGKALKVVKKRGRPSKNAQKTREEPTNLEKQLSMDPKILSKH